MPFSELLSTAMAVEMVKKVVATMIERPEYLLDAPRNRLTRRAETKLLQWIDNNTKVFNEFASELTRVQ